MYSFANLKDPIRTQPGIAERILFALTDWFVPGGIKTPGAWVNYGDEVIIYENHQFKPGHGFIALTLAPEKNSYDAKTIGDTGMQKFANEIKAMVPGSYANLHEMVYNLLGKPAIVLIQDSDCVSRMWYQIGTEDIPARFSTDFTTGQTKEGSKGYMMTITNTASKVYLYGGDISYPGEIADPIIARLVEYIDPAAPLNVISVDGSTSTLYGNVIFHYTVFYNDIDGNPQSVLLPENGDHASFNKSIMVNWNNKGFAISLTIVNEFMSDTTLSTDPLDQRPLIFGGFDEGFSEGFDFNI